MNIDHLKISLSIFVPLLLFALGYLKEKWSKRREIKKERKALLKFLYNLFIELERNIKEYPLHLEEISNVITKNYSKTIFIAFDSHTGGVINRLAKIEAKELHHSITTLIHKKEQDPFFNKVYYEIDYFEDFYKRLLVTIKGYQKTSEELRKEFRSGLLDFMNFHADLLTKLSAKQSHEDYVSFVNELMSIYLTKQTDDLKYHYEEFLRPISLFVRENYRDDYFANEVIERIKRQKIILDDIFGNSMMYSKYFSTNSIELKQSLKKVNNIINYMEKNGM